MGPQYNDFSTAYSAARTQNDVKKLAECVAKLSAILKDHVTAGQTCALNEVGQCNFGTYPGAGKLAANVTWLPAKDCLRVKADVTDRFFAPSALNEAPEDGSSVQLFVCPSGQVLDTNVVTVVPSGAGGKARVTVACGQYGPSSADSKDCATRANAISGAWKRTGKGYTLDVKIPWSVLRGTYDGWKLLPVDAAVNTWSSDGRLQLIMSKLGDPTSEPFIYAALKLK
jgi:hypothetical protein